MDDQLIGSEYFPIWTVTSAAGFMSVCAYFCLTATTGLSGAAIASIIVLSLFVVGLVLYLLG